MRGIGLESNHLCFSVLCFRDCSIPDNEPEFLLINVAWICDGMFKAGVILCLSRKLLIHMPAD